MLLVRQRPRELLDQHHRFLVVQVHLPVAGHQGRAGHGCSFEREDGVGGQRDEHGDAGQLLALEVLEAGATAGGDVAERRLVEAERADRGRGVAAADHREPVDLGQRLGDRAGAGGERVGLEDAHRAVPEHGARTGVRPRRTRPPTRDRCRARGCRRGSRRRRPPAAAARGRRTGTRCRPRCRSAARSRRRSPRPGRGSRGRCRAGRPRAGCLPTSWPWALRKVKTMPPPISSRSALAEQVVDHAELVGDLRAAEHDDVRPLGLVGEPAQHVDLGRHQAAHRRRQLQRDVVDRRLLAMDHAEAVADEGVGQLGELAGEGAADLVLLAGLAGVEADVLEHRDLAVLEPGHGLGGALAHGVGGERDVGARAARRAARPPAPGSTPGPARPSGRPRWAVTTTRAPASASRRMVGTLARIRPSSVIVLPSSGTFRSDRTSTRLPRRSPSARPSMPVTSGRATSERGADVDDQVGEAVGVAPLVVVPADDLDLVADHLGQRGVEDAGRRVGDDVGGDDRVGRVARGTGRRPPP